MKKKKLNNQRIGIYRAYNEQLAKVCMELAFIYYNGNAKEKLEDCLDRHQMYLDKMHEMEEETPEIKKYLVGLQILVDTYNYLVSPETEEEKIIRCADPA